MNVAFGRKPLRRGGQLDFVGAADDHTIAWFQAALHADPVAIAGGNPASVSTACLVTAGTRARSRL